MPVALITGNNNSTTTYPGVLSETGLGSSLTQIGSGTLILTGGNTYQGGTTIVPNAIIQVGNGSTNGQLGTGGVLVSGTLMYDHSDTFTENNSISGGGGVQQNGSGTLILAANSSFTGLVSVNSGTLLANNTNGSVVGRAGVQVNSGGTLGGNGLIGGVSKIERGGTLVPGSQGFGILSFTNALTLEAGSTTTFQISATNSFTSINLIGHPLTYGGALTFNITSYTSADGNSFTLFNMTGGATERGILQVSKRSLVNRNFPSQTTTESGVRSMMELNISSVTLQVRSFCHLSPSPRPTLFLLLES